MGEICENESRTDAITVTSGGVRNHAEVTWYGWSAVAERARPAW